MTYTFRGLTLPDELEASIRRYVDHGIPTGDFLQACIENDLSGACARADEQNWPLIPVIVAYLRNECPAYCWGFNGAFQRWLEVKQKERESGRSFLPRVADMYKRKANEQK